MSKVHNQSVLMSRPSSADCRVQHTDTGPLYRICSPSDKATRLRNIHRFISSVSPQISISRCAWIVGPPLVYFSFHDRKQGCLRRHLFQQELDCCRPGHVFSAGNKSDGKGDVWLSRVDAQRRPRRAYGVRDSRPQRLRTKRNLSALLSSPNGVSPSPSVYHRGSACASASNWRKCGTRSYSHDPARLSASCVAAPVGQSTQFARKNAWAGTRRRHSYGYPATCKGHSFSCFLSRVQDSSVRRRSRRSNDNRIGRLQQRSLGGLLQSDFSNVDKNIDYNKSEKWTRPAICIPFANGLVKDDASSSPLMVLHYYSLFFLSHCYICIISHIFSCTPRTCHLVSLLGLSLFHFHLVTHTPTQFALGTQDAYISGLRCSKPKVLYVHNFACREHSTTD